MQEPASEVTVPDDARTRTWRDGVAAWVLAIRAGYARIRGSSTSRSRVRR